jgi:hypothetical protein
MTDAAADAVVIFQKIVAGSLVVAVVDTHTDAGRVVILANGAEPALTLDVAAFAELLAAAGVVLDVARQVPETAASDQSAEPDEVDEHTLEPTA